MNNKNSKYPTVKIIIATHKPYRVPADDMYVPLLVGAELRSNISNAQNFIKDNTGDNISELNPYFCELTGLYWAWKNLDADYLGLVHYRRYFGWSKGRDPFSRILTYEQIKPYLEEIKVFVPKKRRYFIETLYSHYAHTHYADQLDETREIISEKYPEYIASYDSAIRQRQGYMFNMVIMEQGLLNTYCTWLFNILFELKERIPTQDLSGYEKRFFGRVAEILLNVWLKYQVDNGHIKKTEIIEIPCIHMEKENWVKKCGRFIGAKFFGVKYEVSDINR